MIAIAQTDKGLVRSSNQDTVYCSTSQVGILPNLFVVADGMGGGQAGDYASSSLIQEVIRLILNSPQQYSYQSVLRHAIENANLKLYMDACAHPELSGMGTTLVTAVIDGDRLYVSNVGDSRLYVIRKDAILQITKDHSYVQEMVDMGVLDVGSEDYIKNKNLITRAMAMGASVDIDFFETELETGDRILLCSDGLTNMLTDEDILRIVSRASDTEDAVDRLIFEANISGGRDNISVILISPGEEKVSA